MTPVEAPVVLVVAVTDEVFSEAAAVVSDEPLSEPQPLNMAASVTSVNTMISLIFPVCI